MVRFASPRLALAALLVLLPAAEVTRAAEADVAGSRDPFGVPRYPLSWIVSYQRDEEMQSREFVMSRVDRIRRDLRVDERLRLPASLETVTYRIPDGVPVANVVDHYLDELGSDVLFRCDGRGCGRSADWANQIFGESILYGPDSNQHYVAVEWQGRLVALYAVERGNQRVYAHLRFLEPEDSVGPESHALLVRRLTGRGWAVVEGARPEPDGTLPESTRAVLASAGEHLTGLGAGTVYVVCHLYGRGAPERLVADSMACAQTAAGLLAAASEASSEGGGDGPARFEPFGAGPMLPRTAAEPRLELVLPDALRPGAR